MSLDLKPLGSRVLVEPVEENEVTAGGIVLPDTAKEKPQKGIISPSVPVIVMKMAIASPWT